MSRSMHISLSRPVAARGWLVRVLPLAVVALIGCTEEKPDALEVEVDEEGVGEEEEAGHEDCVEPTDEEAQARLADECAQRFSCECSVDRFADVAACEAHYTVEWAGISAKAEAAGLIPDLECYMRGMPFETFGCDSYTEFAADEEPLACSYCQVAYGERQVGETCQDFGGGISDCAQGLLCPPAYGEASVCIDPCSQAGEGESCDYLLCADGLACDWTDMTCRASGGAGEVCLDGTCDEGLVCDWTTNLCKQGVGLGADCSIEPCAAGLFCGQALVCAPAAGPGESCADVPCAAGLACRWDAMLCEAPAAEGESCLGIECAAGLFCDSQSGSCVPPGALGESCGERPCVDGLLCDFNTLTCGVVPGLGEPCSEFCTEGLVCDYAGTPALCAALPGEGEPCVSGVCAANLVCDYETNGCVPEPPALCGL